ncbi:hypothetical protein JHK87_050228 [Glycine soja]|nr:hypothetical protein JHK87_050228 [Glycine soja]
MTRIDRYGSNSSVTPFNSFSFSVRNLSGEWISTPPVTGTLVCNIGDMLKFVSMEIPENQRWMYQRLDVNKRWTNEFREGVFEFI